MKSLDPLGPTLEQWVLHSFWWTMPGLVWWWQYAGSFWRIKELIPITGRPRSPDLNAKEHLWDIMFSTSNATRLHLRQSRSSVMPSSRSGRITSRTPLIRNMPRHCQAWIQTCTMQITEHYFKLLQLKIGLARRILSSLWLMWLHFFSWTNVFLL